MREVREIRFGRSVKEFDKYPEEIGSHDAPLCMALMYGSEFRLKTLALAGNRFQHSPLQEFESDSLELLFGIAIVIHLLSLQLLVSVHMSLSSAVKSM